MQYYHFHQFHSIILIPILLVWVLSAELSVRHGWLPPPSDTCLLFRPDQNTESVKYCNNLLIKFFDTRIILKTK